MYLCGTAVRKVQMISYLPVIEIQSLSKNIIYVDLIN